MDRTVDVSHQPTNGETCSVTGQGITSAKAIVCVLF